MQDRNRIPWSTISLVWPGDCAESLWEWSSEVEGLVVSRIWSVVPLWLSLSADQKQGVLRALEERGIPIDYIAGTSIGALIGGLYARECDIIMSTNRAKQFSGRMGNIWRMLSDVTYPIVAYTTVSH
jgi:hypothetical protein